MDWNRRYDRTKRRKRHHITREEVKESVAEYLRAGGRITHLTADNTNYTEFILKRAGLDRQNNADVFLRG